MAWSYTAGILTSTGATEALPDSLLAGIAVVQAADATRGYRNGNVAWLNDVEVRYGNSAVIIDDDSCISMRGSSYLRPANSGGFNTAVVIIHGNRSVFQIASTTNRTDGVISFPNGSTVICRRQNPQDPSPMIRHMGTTRTDYFTVAASANLAKVDIQGIDIYLTSGTNFFKSYFVKTGSATTVVQYKDVRVFGSVSNQLFNSTYTNWYLENLSLSSEATPATFTMVRPTFYLATPGAFVGDLRAATAIIRNPTFLNNCWNGAVNFVTFDIQSVSKFQLEYSYQNIFKQGLTNISGVNIRFTRARQSVNGSPTWTAPNATITATSNGSGTFTAVNLLDAYREGVSSSDLERFNWTAKARKYDKKTASETLFTNRVLFQHSVNMSAGYSEEVQMLQVPYITLTETQALALAGISFAPSGTTSGVITLTQSRTVAELWQSYRAWISQTANFDSEDSWTYDGTTLNIGGWSIVGLQFLTNGAITTNTATAVGVLSNITINGNVNQNVPTNLNSVVITETLTYNTNTNTTITITDTTIGTVVNLGTGIITINKVNSTIDNYTDAEINFIDSTISVIGADTVTFHPTANDRDLNINASGSFSGSYAFKFGSTINGSLMSGTLYLRCVAGGIPFNVNKSIVLGDNLVDLGTTAQLASLSAKIDLTAKESTLLQTESDIVAEINANEVKIDAVKTKVDTLQNADFTATNAKIDSKPSLAQIEGSNVIAKEATSQTINTKVQTLSNYNDATAQGKLDAIKAKTDTLVNTDISTLSKKADTDLLLKAADYVAPDNTKIAQIKTKVDTLENYDDTVLEGKVDAIKAKTDTLVNTNLTVTNAKIDALGNPLQENDYLAPDNDSIAKIKTNTDLIPATL